MTYSTSTPLKWAEKDAEQMLKDFGLQAGNGAGEYSISYLFDLSAYADYNDPNSVFCPEFTGEGGEGQLEGENPFGPQEPVFDDEECVCATNYILAAELGIDCDNYQIQYWCHPDYLGHTEIVSDANGDQYEFHWYAPFGETIKSAKANTTAFSSPYLFNAKEYDSEPTAGSSRTPLKTECREHTGNYYDGARYYNPELSVCLSVDPLAHRYPIFSPYVFTGNNTLNILDPDGRRIVIVHNLHSTNDPNSKMKEMLTKAFHGLVNVSFKNGDEK